jgi:hypothetical protein
MQAKIKGYSQWFLWKENNFADVLSHDWHQTDNELTSILHFHFPLQLPDQFKIALLPNEISSWLISLLQRLPVNKQLWEAHMTTNLEPGNGGQVTATRLECLTSTWMNLINKIESSSSVQLPLLSGREDFCMNGMNRWLREQSRIPFPLWYRPSQRQAGKNQHETTTMSLASFYCGNFLHTGTTILSSNNEKPF